jgi:DNA polymerase delta subunit 4
MPIASKTIKPSAAKGSGTKGKQPTLSFKKKVVKAIKTPKEDYKSPPRTKEWVPKSSPEPESKKHEEDVSSAATDDKHDDSLPQPEPKSEAVAQAEKINDKAIQQFWDEINEPRSAKAVHKKHTEGLTTEEKILRYFDVSSQYGVRNRSTSDYPRELTP